MNLKYNTCVDIGYVLTTYARNIVTAAKSLQLSPLETNDETYNALCVLPELIQTFGKTLKKGAVIKPVLDVTVSTFVAANIMLNLF